MRTSPLSHQKRLYEDTRERDAFGVWWEQGTGKTKPLIDTFFHLLQRGAVDAMLVVAPSGVHANALTQEMPKHAWCDDYVGHVYYTDRSNTKRGQLEIERLMEAPIAVLVMSYDAVRTPRGFAVAERFLKQRRALMAADESTAIAEPTTERSKKMALLGRLAPFRRAMSGTPVADGPFKIYNQVRWLVPDYWKQFGLGSYFAFQNRFGIFKQVNRHDGRQFRELVQYRDLDVLSRMIAPISDRVLKEDVLDLPPKVYTRIDFEMAPKQRKLYDEIKKQLKAELDSGAHVDATQAIVKMTRLQQITSGFVGARVPPEPRVGDPVIYRGEQGDMVGEIVSIDGESLAIVVAKRDSEETWRLNVLRGDPTLIRLVREDDVVEEIFEKDSDNPRLCALQGVVEPLTHKVIVWARYRRDVDSICRLLGDAAVRYDGLVSHTQREQALDRFRTDSTIQFFVANPATLSMGVTLVEAKTVVYYSNSFYLEKRLQTEDRAHRIGQDQKVNIVDLVARDTIDEYIVKSLREKFELAALVSGDRLRDWLR